MTEQPDDLDREDAPEEDATEKAQEEAAVAKSLPDWVPGGAQLGQVLRMEDVASTFGEASRQFAQRERRRGFIFRLFGGAFTGGYVNAIELGQTLARWGRAVAWTNNSLAGKRFVPGIEYAAALSSVVVHFRANPEETPIAVGGVEMTPTAESGLWLSALLHAEEPDIYRAAEILRPRATGTYLKALEELADLEVSLDSLILDERPRHLTVSRQSIEETIAVLEQPVGIKVRHVTVTGAVYAADQYRHRFKMEVLLGELAGRTISGTYGAEASETLEGAWRKAVDAVIAISEPERPGLPRAPLTRFELVRVRRIREDLKVPPEPEQLALGLD